MNDIFLKKLPPQDIEAEESIISSLLYDFETSKEIVRMLTPSDFYRSAHQKIFNAIVDLFEDGSPVDVVSVVSFLKDSGELKIVGGATYISRFPETIPVAVNIRHYTDIIIEKAKLRRLINRLNETIERCFDLEKSTDTIELLHDQIDKIREGISGDITQDSIERWISQSPGEFSLIDVYRDLNIKSVSQKSRCTRILESMVKGKKLEYSKNRRGQYRPLKSDLVEMDFRKASGEPSKLWLPLKIHEMVNVYPGNIIQINGEKNSGKTGYVLNVIKGNRNAFNVHYFNSEMGEDELKIRLSNFEDITLDMWNFKAYSRSDNFGDVLFTGENDLNIIDFLECHEDFWKMGKFMKDIHDKLGKGIAVVCVQKNQGSEMGLGGGRTEEKPRLILNIAKGVLTIKMAKNWKNKTNPNGKSINFKLVGGCKFLPQGGWYE